ncbi:hypothetical protein HAALTHF_20240n [Vreelandella aquamarina]|nr:hypothetical protein HAALTHF_20240n [Halomonas axialensis]
MLPVSATRLEADGSERILPASELAPGDRVLIKPGHGVPADGIIEDGESSLDESMLTGEYLPVTRRVGEQVVGGSQTWKTRSRCGLLMQATMHAWRALWI